MGVVPTVLIACPWSSSAGIWGVFTRGGLHLMRKGSQRVHIKNRKTLTTVGSSDYSVRNRFPDSTKMANGRVEQKITGKNCQGKSSRQGVVKEQGLGMCVFTREAATNRI